MVNQNSRLIARTQLAQYTYLFSVKVQNKNLSGSIYNYVLFEKKNIDFVSVLWQFFFNIVSDKHYYQSFSETKIVIF
jgi:hypothetical protein